MFSSAYKPHSHCLYSASTCRAHLLADWETSPSLDLHWFSSLLSLSESDFQALAQCIGTDSWHQYSPIRKEQVPNHKFSTQLSGEWRHSAFNNILYFPRKRLKLNASALKNLWKCLNEKGSTSVKHAGIPSAEVNLCACGFYNHLGKMCGNWILTDRQDTKMV